MRKNHDIIILEVLTNGKTSICAIVCKIMDEKLGESNGTSEQLIAYVKTVRT
jgi:hypothetical protein